MLAQSCLNLLNESFIRRLAAVEVVFSKKLPCYVAYFFLTAVDVFAASMELEVISESDRYIIGRKQYNLCRHSPDLCSLPAGGK